MAINTAEIMGKMHTGIKKGKITNSTSTTDSQAAIAGWIIANIYDTESFKGENRAVLLTAIAQACALYKGDI
jgi:hypothetical protein